MTDEQQAAALAAIEQLRQDLAALAAVVNEIALSLGIRPRGHYE